MILQTYNMFYCDKVKNNEVQGYLFFTPMSRSGAIFFALAHETKLKCLLRSRGYYYYENVIL